MKTLLKLSMFLACFYSCTQMSDQSDNLYSIFRNPPAEARPFVRWWWNGDCIEETELIRELDILQAAGIGGVEINPIAMPADATQIEVTCYDWNSPEWINLLKITCEAARERNMIPDLIIGSGWPFGGRFLSDDEIIQRVAVCDSIISGPGVVSVNVSNLIQISCPGYQENEKPVSSELFFIRLVPEGTDGPEKIINLKDLIKDGHISYSLDQGEYKIVWGVLQKGHRYVVHGAPGADGSVMNHLDKNVTLAYLNRLNNISELTGIPLKDLIRALFCDSIELAGSNWTDDFSEEFKKRCGYDLEPYFPFIFYPPRMGYSDLDHDKYIDHDFREDVKRVRYDFNHTLVDIFLERFVQTCQDFCSDIDIMFRYQAYGYPWLVGISEGYLIPDIPESNNWIYSLHPWERDYFTWSKEHGFMIWNKFAAAGGHLAGRKIISCEAMTNTKGVFATSLETIKQADDMNFISGINHSVLHGFNYSPPAAGFPGWVRYGTYFSEQNTWWPYLRLWTDYNSRLSAVFQNSTPVTGIAVLAPFADSWSDRGLLRVPFQTTPWYWGELWESISQNGNSCDYISEKILQEARLVNGTLKYGPMTYHTLILPDITTLEPSTAHKVFKFSRNGGKVIFIGSLPSRSPSQINAKESDQLVQEYMNKIMNLTGINSGLVESPHPSVNLLDWTKNLFNRFEIEPDIVINNPIRWLYQIHHKTKSKDIFFFVNSNRKQTVNFTANCNIHNRTPWIWYPETGEREIFPFEEDPSSLNIRLDPLQSLLVVYDTISGNPIQLKADSCEQYFLITGPWQLHFAHVNGTEFNLTFNELTDLSQSDDPRLSTFAGTIVYSKEIELTEIPYSFIDLVSVNGISELWINDEYIGTCWYGKHRYPIENFLQAGKNKIEIKIITVLANFIYSLTENPTAQTWSNSYKKSFDQHIPAGITEAVVLE